MKNEEKFEVPTSTKWNVGFSAITMIFVVGSMLVLIFTQLPYDFEAASPFMRTVLLGAVIGTIFAVASLCFNIIGLLFMGIGTALMFIGTGIYNWIKNKMRDEE